MPGIKVLLLGSISNIEFMIINVAVISITLVCVYRPPGSQTLPYQEVLAKLRCCLNQQNNSPFATVLCGDFNFPSICWTSLTIQGGTAADRQQAESFLEFLSDKFLHQFIEEPTRGNSILDLFAVDDAQFVLRTRVLNKSKISDHNLTWLIPPNAYPLLSTTPLTKLPSIPSIIGANGSTGTR